MSKEEIGYVTKNFSERNNFINFLHLSKGLGLHTNYIELMRPSNEI